MFPTRVLTISALSILAVVVSQAQDAILSWQSGMAVGQAAFSEGRYAEAVVAFEAALAKGEQESLPAPALLPILRSLASARRVTGKYLEAEQTYQRALTITSEGDGPSSAAAAELLPDVALMQRAQERRPQAVETLRQAIRIGEVLGLGEGLARNWTSLAAIQEEMGEDENAMASYQTAIARWGALPGSGLQILTAIDPLAHIYRDRLEYTNVERLCLWALRLRESALGVKDAQLIATLDLLAYALFGQKRYADAEPVYQRLLALWEQSAGPDHPMIALTLDKMVEFYSAQKLYDKAEPLARRSLGMRTKAVIESFHRTGRMLVGREKIEEAADLYARVIRIAADAQIADEEIGGILKTHVQLMRQLKRDEEARRLEQRLRKPPVAPTAPQETTPPRGTGVSQEPRP